LIHLYVRYEGKIFLKRLEPFSHSRTNENKAEEIQLKKKKEQARTNTIIFEEQL